MKKRTDSYIESQIKPLKEKINSLTKVKTEYRIRVKAGIAFLDTKFARTTWLKKVQIKKLDISSNGDCVLGQVFKNPYTIVLDGDERNKDKISFSKAVSLGFAELKTASARNFELLNAVWYDELSALKKKLCQ